MKTLRFALLKTLPITVSYFFVSIAYGIMLSQVGFGPLFAGLSSAIVFTGAYQFVLITFLSSGASLVTVMLTCLFMNSRHIFYGISFVDEYKKTGKFYPYMIHTLSDETYSLMCSVEYPPEVNREKAMVLIHFLDWASWVLGSIVGSVLGQLLPVDFGGFDFALSALFVTIFIDQWKGTDRHQPALIGLVISAVSLIVFGADNFILPSLILASGLLVLFRPAIEGEGADE